MLKASWALAATILSVGLVVGAGDAHSQSKLPPCPESTSVQWTNCFGERTYSKGGVYVGEFQNGKRNGHGTYTFTSGSVYVGEYRDDVRNGHGTYTYASGSVYVGEYKDGQRNGRGTYNYASGSVYVGEYKDGKRDGHGTYWFGTGDSKGDVYVGEYSAGNRSGLGTYTYSDGRRSVGNFSDGELNGRGVRYAADGTVRLQGIFENGSLVSSQQVEAEVLAAVRASQPGSAAVAATPPKALPSGPSLTSQHKVALVIGNSAYQNTPQLRNPGNDAQAVTAMLGRMGFEVMSGTDLTKVQMETLARDFITKARQADTALVFYAGHGIQVAGQNYLVPIDAEMKDEAAIDFELLNVNTISNYLGGPDQVGIILLDACRDNPLATQMASHMGGGRSALVGRGLERINSPRGGLLVGFATAPGTIAADGQGGNSPFTSALLNHFSTPGLEIQQIMTRVKAEVIENTNQAQRPWHNSDLAKEVYLVGD